MNEYKKIPYDEVPDAIKAIVGPESPSSQKHGIMQDIETMQPVVTVIALYILMDDPDEEIKEAARKALISLPESVLYPALADKSIHPHVLDFFFCPEPAFIKEIYDASNNEKKSIHKKGENLDLWRQVADMTIGQKIVLAQTGNKEARTLLMRESNKTILRALVNNGRITEAEVLLLANSRSVDEDILRTIASNREWVKDYKMKLALIRNPKCPIEASRQILLYLHKNDLQEIARSKDIPSVISEHARKLYARKPTSQ
ncbi:MAG: hypothetical protein ACMUIP_01005 [bacterium]